MPLSEPRASESLEFHKYPGASHECTLGDPERIIWSSIKQLCVRDVAQRVLSHTYKIRSQRRTIAGNMRLYIQQAAEFYEAASSAKANTAPLFYYYCFLNLAKARCEIFCPKFHERDESYRHGISWRPNPKYTVDMETESVSLTTRGIWHVLWEALTGQSCRVPNPLALRIKDLFSFCREISSECQRALGQELKLIELHEPDILFDPDRNEVWVRFSIDRYEIKEHGMSRPKLLQLITPAGSRYRQVKSSDADLWTFESETPKKIGRNHFFHVVRDEMRAFNLFVDLRSNELVYTVPLQTRLPLSLPHLIVLYTLMFWLGSLVRYDPHSVVKLQESEYWILIDGFMNQSRIWLLELFEWELYQMETALLSVR